MKKMFKGLLSISIFPLAIGISLGFIFNNHQPSSADNEYSITFDANTNCFHNQDSQKSGTNDKIKTASGQDVSFSYTDVIGLANNSWHYIAPNGGFQNLTRINGISSLNIKFKNTDIPFKIEWSKDADFKTFDSVSKKSADSYYCNFNNYFPSYFRFVNEGSSNLDIECMTLIFNCKLEYPNVDISSKDHGNITSTIVNGPTKAGTKFMISAVSENTYTFDGWYNTKTSILFSKDLILSLTVGNEDLYLEARFILSDSNYKAFAFIEGNGTVSGSGTHKHNERVTFEGTPEEGYISQGWFDASGNQLTEETNYSFDMPLHDVCYVTKFKKLYNIEYSSKEDEGTISGPNTAIEGQKVTLTALPNYDKELAFDCWKNKDGKIISEDNPYTFTMPNYDLYFSAEFKKGVKLTLTSSNENYGTVTGSGYYLEGRRVTVYATCKNDNVFFGWFESNSYFGSFSHEKNYEFTFWRGVTSLYAKFLSASEYQSWAENHGVFPKKISETTLTYGIYPQTHVNDEDLIDKLYEYCPKYDEVYFLYNNEIYVKDSANPSGDYTFSDNTVVEEGFPHFFKCEPITWNIISSDDGTYSLECTNILYGHTYDNSNFNNYSDSDIRKWLNNDFYDQAFFLNDSYIQITTVDNSGDTTDKPDNPYACDDTHDKIYLRSYQDWAKGEQSSKFKKVSDYAISNYACMSTESSFSRNGLYWTRSPYSGDNFSSWCVDERGNFFEIDVTDSDGGCSPALTIKF